MKTKELQDWIQENLFDKNGNLSGQRTKKKWFENKNLTHYYDQILLHTQFLNQKTPSFSERLYCIYNNISKMIVCKHCKSNNVTFRNFSIGYDTYCCYDCSHSSNSKKEKYIKTCRRKYGVDNVSQVGWIKDKRKNTFIQTTGYDNPAKSPVVQQKTKNTVKGKWGKDYYFQTGDKLYKSIQTSREKYNTDFPSQSDYIKNKTRLTNRKKYDCDYHIQSHIINSEYLTKEYIEKYFLTGEKYVKSDNIQEFFNIGAATVYRKLNDLEVDYIHRANRSEGEDQLYEYISSIYNEQIDRNNHEAIAPFELDIYLPDKKIAFEYNGLPWHSEGLGTDKNYHLMKTLKCRDKGIRLFHVFENEWNDKFKREIWKSVVSSNIGTNNRIYARKCIVKEIDNKTKDQFLSKNHLQGQCPSSKRIGLYYNDELVSLLTVSKSRFTKDFKWELMRYCSKLCTNVVGGFSKLLKYFTNNYTGSIVTYADLCYSEGDLYKKNGFKKGRINKPSYFYCKNGFESLNRMSTQKKKLEKLLKKYDPNLTEHENMINNNWFKIWRCGTIQFYLK